VAKNLRLVFLMQDDLDISDAEAKNGKQPSTQDGSRWRSMRELSGLTTSQTLSASSIGTSKRKLCPPRVL
jgi:hypothetical protein